MRGLLILLTATLAWAQRFDVATIKQNKDCAGGTGSAAALERGPGRLHERCITLANFLQSAYVVYAGGHNNAARSAPLEGAPPWLSQELYEIHASAEGNPRAEVMRGPMLQALLEERLSLKLHREVRQVSVYNLTLAKSGSKLEPYQEGLCRPLDVNSLAPRTADQLPNCLRAFRSQGGKVLVTMQGLTVNEFAQLLAVYMDRPIIDTTGITGLFNFKFEFEPDQSTPRLSSRRDPNEPGGTSIFTAIQELGLKLEPAKGPQEVLVIDHVERPSEN